MPPPRALLSKCCFLRACVQRRCRALPLHIQGGIPADHALKTASGLKPGRLQLGAQSLDLGIFEPHQLLQLA